MAVDYSKTIIGNKVWNQAIEEACNEFTRTYTTYFQQKAAKKAPMNTPQKTLQAILEIATEFDSAANAFPPFASPHEGYAILKEEVDELWDEVKKKPSLRSNMALEKEAIQVAAMALRFLVDVCYKGK